MDSHNRGGHAFYSAYIIEYLIALSTLINTKKIYPDYTV